MFLILQCEVQIRKEWYFNQKYLCYLSLNLRKMLITLLWTPLVIINYKILFSDESLKQYRNIARQYAYFYKLFHTATDAKGVLFLKENFCYDAYR